MKHVDLDCEMRLNQLADVLAKGGPYNHVYNQGVGLLVRLDEYDRVLTMRLPADFTPVYPGDCTIGCLACITLKLKYQEFDVARPVSASWAQTSDEAAVWLGLYTRPGVIPRLFHLPRGEVTVERAELAVRRVIAGVPGDCWA